MVSDEQLYQGTEITENLSVSCTVAFEEKENHFAKIISSSREEWKHVHPTGVE